MKHELMKHELMRRELIMHDMITFAGIDHASVRLELDAWVAEWSNN